jgi:hypothetical protein
MQVRPFVIHHAGRSDEARGTSKREDVAFWVIALDDAKKQSDDKRGARFISRSPSQAATHRKKFSPTNGMSSLSR